MNWFAEKDLRWLRQNVLSNPFPKKKQVPSPPTSKRAERKKKTSSNEEVTLTYKSKNGTKKNVCWILPKTKRITKKSPKSKEEKCTSQSSLSYSQNLDDNDDVNYAEIFFSVYEKLEQEKNLNETNSESNEIIEDNLTKSCEIKNNKYFSKNTFNLKSKKNLNQNKIDQTINTQNFKEQSCLIVPSAYISQIAQNISLNA